MFRNLRAEEIECRIGNMKDKQNAEKGYSILLYKDARCDMQILDETVGPFNWSREHKELKGVIYCGVTINNANAHVAPLGVSATKWDAGSESNTEAQKGEASDSFKRACVNWGIGRELYTAPFIWVQGYSKYEKFKVHSIDYEGKTITSLAIVDSKGKVAYSFGSQRKPKQPPQPAEVIRISEAQAAELSTLIMNTGTNLVKFFDFFGVGDVNDFTVEMYNKAVAMLQQKAKAVAFSGEGLPEAMKG